MIKINKSATPPQVLTTKGSSKTKGLKISYSKNINAYNNGTKPFNIDSKIYGHKSVKIALKNDQVNKCCFCESKVSHVAFGDVEHFRPKKGFKQNGNDNLGRPGYYWLAYEWKNLFFSCQICNQRHKKNLFPLINNHNRCLNHKGNLNSEEPMFIDPSTDDPEEYIAFRKEVPYAINGNARGRITIKELGLDRPDLDNIRYDKYETFEVIYHLSNGDPNKSQTQKAIALLQKSAQKSAQFSSMIKSAIRDGFSI